VRLAAASGEAPGCEYDNTGDFSNRFVIPVIFEAVGVLIVTGDLVGEGFCREDPFVAGCCCLCGVSDI
jgi:hypothetical protein